MIKSHFSDDRMFDLKKCKEVPCHTALRRHSKCSKASGRITKRKIYWGNTEVH